MRVLHIIVGLNVGGAELMLKRLIEPHPDSLFFQHSVISLTDIGEVGQQLKTFGIEVEAMGMRNFFDIPRILWTLTRLIRSARPDIVQTWMYHADLLGGLAARFACNRNVIWGIRSTDIRAGGSRATLLVRRLCALLSHWVPHTIICAAEASRKIHVALGYDAGRMKVIPNGFDMSRLVATSEQTQNLREQLGLQEKNIIIGGLGRYSRVKDQENFVRAAGVLAQQYPDARFLMVGRDLDSDNADLNRCISETGYADRFFLLGERSDVPVCLSVMDIFCLHSRTEGFPNVLGEAMAMGLPCVATDVGDAALLLKNGGVIVPKEDTAALVQGIEKLLCLTPAKRAELGQYAKQRIRDEFTLARTRDRFEEMYNNILNRDIS